MSKETEFFEWQVENGFAGWSQDVRRLVSSAYELGAHHAGRTSGSGEAVAWLCEWDDDQRSYCRTLSWTNAVGGVDNRKVKFTPLSHYPHPSASVPSRDELLAALKSAYEKRNSPYRSKGDWVPLRYREIVDVMAELEKSGGG